MFTRQISLTLVFEEVAHLVKIMKSYIQNGSIALIIPSQTAIAPVMNLIQLWLQ